MLIHPTMTMAIAEAKRDDLVREVRGHRNARHTAQLRRQEALSAPPGTRLGGVAQGLRRALRPRAAEPAS